MPDEEKYISENIIFCYINYPLAFCELSERYLLCLLYANSVVSWAFSELALKYV